MTEQGFIKRLIHGATEREVGLNPAHYPANEPVQLNEHRHEAPPAPKTSTVGATVNNLAKARDLFHERAAILEQEIATRSEELRQCVVSAKAVTLALSELSDDDALTDAERERSGF